MFSENFLKLSVVSSYLLHLTWEQQLIHEAEMIEYTCIYTNFQATIIEFLEGL